MILNTSTKVTVFDAAVSHRTGHVFAGTSHGIFTWTRLGVPRGPCLQIVTRERERYDGCGSDVSAVAPDVDWHDDASGGQVVAAGLRNGGISLLDTRSRRWTPDGGGRMTSLVTDLHVLRRFPFHLVAAAADGSLARWDIRNPSAPVAVYAVGSEHNFLCQRRRCALDPSESFVVMDTGRWVPPANGWPNSGKSVASVSLWDVRTGQKMWLHESSTPLATNPVQRAHQEDVGCYSSVAVEHVDCPGDVPTLRVWAGGGDALRVFVPDPIMNACLHPSISSVGSPPLLYH